MREKERSILNVNKAESRPIDASSEPPRVTQSYPESFRVTQQLLRGTPEQSGNGRMDGRTDGPTEQPTDIPTYRDARTHLKSRFPSFLIESTKSRTSAPLFLTFLDASSHLYKRVCPSVRPSLRLSVGYHFVLVYLLVTQGGSGRLCVTPGNS